MFTVCCELPAGPAAPPSSQPGDVAKYVGDMSSKNSPSSRSSRGRRTGARPVTRSARTESAPAPQAGPRSAGRRSQRSAIATPRPAKAEPTPRMRRAKWLFSAVAVPHLAVVGLAIALCLAGLLVFGAPLAWLPTAIASTWMVVNLGSLSIDDLSVSVLPALPAVGFFALLAWQIHKAVREKVSVKDLLYLLGAVVSSALALMLITWLMLWDAGKVYDVAGPGLLPLAPRVLLLHLSALACGMGPRLWRALAKRYGVPRIVVDSAVSASRVTLFTLAAAAVVLVIFLAVGWQRQGQLLAEYPQLPGTGLAALIAMSIGYVPNALVGIAATLVGGDLHVGPASYSLFDIIQVPLPPVPLLAALPPAAAPWAPALLLIPAVVSGWVFYKQRPNFLHAALAAGWSAIFAALLAFFMSGAAGIYGNVGPTLLFYAGLQAMWVLGAGIIVAAVDAILKARAAQGEQDELADAEPADAVPAEVAADAETDGDAEENADTESDTESDTEAEAEAETEEDTEAAADATGEEDADAAEEEASASESDDAESDAESDGAESEDAESDDVEVGEAELVEADVVEAEVVEGVPVIRDAEVEGTDVADVVDAEVVEEAEVVGEEESEDADGHSAADAEKERGNRG